MATKMRDMLDEGTLLSTVRRAECPFEDWRVGDLTGFGADKP